MASSKPCVTVASFSFPSANSTFIVETSRLDRGSSRKPKLQVVRGEDDSDQNGFLCVATGTDAVRSSLRTKIPRWSQSTATTGAAFALIPGSGRHHGEFPFGFHCRGREYGQLHDTGEKPSSVPLPVFGAEARLWHEAELFGEYIRHVQRWKSRWVCTHRWSHRCLTRGNHYSYESMALCCLVWRVRTTYNVRKTILYIGANLICCKCSLKIRWKQL